jgi:nucleoid-associated protein YgaU
VKIGEIIEEGAKKPADNKKRVTCPACNKTMLERNFRYSHQAVCGKPRVRVKPIEAIIEERAKPKAKAKPAEDVAPAPPAPPAPPAQSDYWELRKQYNSHLKEKKQQLVKKLVSRAF